MTNFTVLVDETTTSVTLQEVVYNLTIQASGIQGPAGSGGGGAVNSVNGHTGTVVVSKSDVGLGSVDNTSDASKPVSTAQQTALDLKVDKVTGKALSTEDYTTAEKTKLSGIASGATANSPDATLLNRANHTGTQTASTISDFSTAASSVAPVQSVAGKTGAVTLTKSDVGLSSVPNTDATARANHTGTQLSSTISDFASSVIAQVLTGLSTATNAAATATDSILAAIGKLQAQIAANIAAIAGKEPSISSGTSSQYLRGDKSWQTLDKTAVGLSNVPNTDATALVAALMATQDLQYFGDGSDGNVSVTSPITLTSDMYYNNLTISGSGVITTGGYKIFVAGILDVSNAGANAIKVTTGTGNAAAGATGGTLATVGAAQTCGIGGVGVAGVAGTTAAGTSPGASSGAGCMGGPSGTGGKGGNGTNAGGNGRAGTSPATFVTVNAILRDLIRGVTLMVGGVGSTSGSAGGGDGTNTGGGGGGGITGAGVLYLAARTINRGSSTAVGAIAAVGNKGGKGGNSTAGNTGGGGGAPGSGGGWIYLVYRYLTGTTATTAINLTGGDGGDGGNGFGTGLGGQGGSSGIGGRLTLVCVDTSIITDTTGTAAGNTSNTASVPATTVGSTGAAATFFGVNL